MKVSSRVERDLIKDKTVF